MSFFNPTQPILSLKATTLDYQDLQGLLTINIRIKDKILFSTIYTRIDQVFAIWGVVSATIFITAQFAPISWITQAIVWSILTAIASIAMMVLTHFWVKVEKLCWVLYSWVILMVGGCIITNLGIFLGIGQILMNLCNLWLVLCAVGYFLTGLGLRSRAFIGSGFFHLLGMVILPYFLGWEFLVTGLILVVPLLVFAQTRWDMRLSLVKYFN